MCALSNLANFNFDLKVGRLVRHLVMMPRRVVGQHARLLKAIAILQWQVGLSPLSVGNSTAIQYQGVWQ